MVSNKRWPRYKLKRKLCWNAWSQVVPSLLLTEAQAWKWVLAWPVLPCCWSPRGSAEAQSTCCWGTSTCCAQPAPLDWLGAQARAETHAMCKQCRREAHLGWSPGSCVPLIYSAIIKKTSKPHRITKIWENQISSIAGGGSCFCFISMLYFFLTPNLNKSLQALVS